MSDEETYDEPAEATEEAEETYEAEAAEEPEAEAEDAGGDDGDADADAGDAYAEEEPAADEKEPEPEPEPEPEATYEEPTSFDAPSGDYDADSAWAEIAKDGYKINWYAVQLVDGKTLEFDRAGTGGLAEVRKWLADQSAKILFCLLRVNPGDSSGSSRAKFVFIRFIGTEVGVMQKAKAGTKGSEVDAMFPVKHISLELSNDEFLEKQLSSEQVAKEFLRVGGAHKPEFYDFGPGQRYALKK